MANVNILKVGRRKSSVARVQLKDGNGKIVINKHNLDDYFGRVSQKKIAAHPLSVVEIENKKFDIIVNVEGGGLSGQAGAISHGIARALVDLDKNYRTPLKKAGLLTRDPREKERKKYGLRGARRAFQFSKR